MGNETREKQGASKFVMDPGLKDTWTNYTEQNDEKFFRKFVRSLVAQWEKQVAKNWDSLVESSLENKVLSGPSVNDLPEELLPALSKFLFISRDEAEQGSFNNKSIANGRDIIKCLIVICRNNHNIPLVFSMDFVKHITQTNSLLMQQLLEMESSFYTHKVRHEVSNQKLRAEIADFLVESCHLLESIYDPNMRWRSFLADVSGPEVAPAYVGLHPETIPFLYESFETALADCFPAIACELLHVFGSIICGHRKNATIAISPATTKMLLKTVRDSENTSERVHVAAIYCSAKSIQIIHEAPMDERQLDLQLLIEQYQQILRALASKDSSNLATLMEGVAMISRILDDTRNPADLQTHLSKFGMIDTLLDVIEKCHLDADSKKVLLPVIITRISHVLKNCDFACQKMKQINGYQRLFDQVNTLGSPNSNTLHAFLSMATHEENADVQSSSRAIKNVEPISYLLHWLSNYGDDSHELQIWLAESLNSLCSANIQNRMLCCDSGIIVELVNALHNHSKLHPSTAIELLRLIESLGMHSIRPFELKQLVMLLQEDDDTFPFKSHIIHVISSMAKSDGYEACRYYFDIGIDVRGLTIPGIHEWCSCSTGFTFHCWLRLDKLEQHGEDARQTDEEKHEGHKRRQLYSMYTSGGNGFEAFITDDNILVAAVANKKEFLAVPLKDHPITAEKWHCIDICHSAGKRPFGSSHLSVYVDGSKRLECPLKYPNMSEPMSYCQIGSPLQRGNIPALNADNKGTFKEGLIDAIKIGLPGVINLPQTLRSHQNDPHVQWTLIGLEDQLWGGSVSLGGQIGTVGCLQDALTSPQIKMLYALGPNQDLSLLSSAEESIELSDLIARLVFLYSPRTSQNMSCPNLPNPKKFEAQVMAQTFATHNVKDVINCIGGVQVLFPLLEKASRADERSAKDTRYLSMRPENSESRRGSVETDHEWELLPSSSYSDWKLEQNVISGFLTLIKNIVMNHTINTEQLVRGGGVAIIGSMLRTANPKLVDVNVLMASQLLVELAQAMNDSKFMLQIYQRKEPATTVHSKFKRILEICNMRQLFICVLVLFEFAIWTRSEFHVQIGHVQYLSTIIKDDRRFFRKKFGVQFFLDVIRKHYTSPGVLSEDDCKTMRAALFGLVKFYLQRDVTSKEVVPIVTFLLAEKGQHLVRELSEMVAHYLSGKAAKDQMFLVMYESKKADLLYCLLLHREFNHGLKKSILRLLTILLRTNRVSIRHKHRMHLAEARYLGFLHLLFGSEFDVTAEEVLLFLDSMLLFDDVATYQGILGLVQHIQLYDISLKLDVARRIMTCLFTRPEVPQQFARQIGWQECLTRLLVKKVIRPVSRSVSAVVTDQEKSPSLSPSHLLEMATTKAMLLLPGQAGEAVELLGNTASRVVSDTSSKVTSNVNYASELVSDAVLMTQNTVSQKMEKMSAKTQEILERMHLDDVGGFSRRRRLSTMSDDSHSISERPVTPPQFMQALDQFGFEDLSLADFKSASASVEDISVASSVTPTRRQQTEEMETIPDMEVINEDLLEAELRAATKVNTDDKEEELCQLVVNILFTVMWRGLQGATDDIMKERGQVIAAINMLGLNNELFRSHVDLKRRLVEMCVQAVLSDFQEAANYQGNQGPSAEATAIGERVMQWVYDLVVLDRHGDFRKKVSETLLDGVLALMEKLIVFREGDNTDDEWEVMAKMALEVLLKCAENSDDIDTCTMATAKLHALVQTRGRSSVTENAFLIKRLSDIIQRSLREEDKEHFSFVIPVMKALLEKSRDQLHVTTQLPSLNLRKQNAAFFEEFRKYCVGEEWKYFIDRKIAPLHSKYTTGILSDLPREMDVFWAECYELSKVASHKRNREVGESKLKFISLYLEPFHNVVRHENLRYQNNISQQKSHLCFTQRRWKISKRFFFGPRGALNQPGAKESEEHWKLATNENFLRMRMKLIPNPNFDPHLDASAHRDNVKMDDRDKTSLLQVQLSREAVKSLDTSNEDGLTEEELKSIAKEQMETTDEANNELELKSTERLIMAENCQLVTFMSVVKGKLELTNNFLYFFDSSPFKEGEERHDFRFSLNQLREMHLRRFNLRRTGIEFFLVDQTNYFLNFLSNRKRNKVYSKMASMKLPNVVYNSAHSPAELLKSSGLTQKWCAREITNFEYLMQLNTIAGRTFNDLSQYIVFPWIIADYHSETLDLTKPETFRDLSKPIGIQNKEHEDEVRAKYENFEDPNGIISKFHYGTHYSNSAMVLHYLVRVEPFTSLHVELQSGRFDVADRQFHSISQAWKSLYDNVNDVKELIPEFFYFPEFLRNMNNFDLGRLQGGKKKRVDDVVLPKWAKNADDFIRKHRLALESEYVSANLHHWIDLIFGYKQKGPEAVKALNVFYYCSYEGAVNLDGIKDPAEREALEGMINNFGQTPSQLLKEPHPKRMSYAEYRTALFCSKPGPMKVDICLFPSRWKPYMIEMASEADPLVFISVPNSKWKSFIQSSMPSFLITVSANTLLVGTHSWSSSPATPSSSSSTSSTTFTLDKDSSWSSKSRRHLPALMTPKVSVNKKLFVVSPNAKFLFAGGFWDNSLVVYNMPKSKVWSRVVRHIDIITCLCYDDSGGSFIMSGSRDTTSIVWDVGQTCPRPVQVLSGHDKAVTCVALSTVLDMAVSGSADGSINVYTVKEGQYIRSIFPPTFGSDVYTITELNISGQGHVVFTGHSKDVHSIHVYTINGHLVCSSSVGHRITCIQVTIDHIVTGDENGDLCLRELLSPDVIRVVPLHTPIQDLCVVDGNSHVLAALRDGKLIIIALDTSSGPLAQ